MIGARPLPRLALLGTLLGLAAGCGSGHATVPSPGPAAAEREAERALVYVANQDEASVSIIDAATFDVVATVDLESMGYGANAKPHHVAVEADGAHWYVSLIGANRVLKLDRANRFVAEAELEVPGMLALDPESDRLWVARSMSAVNPPPRIAVIDRDRMSVEEISVLFPRPHALVAHPTRPLVYSASLAENSMAVVDGLEEDVDVRDIAPPTGGAGGHQAGGHAMAGHDPNVHVIIQWAVSPDGRTLVGTGEMSGRLLVYDISDAAAPELVTQLPVDARPWHPVFSPDGAEVWFASKGSNTVTVVETSSWTPAATVEGEGLAEPHGAAVSADGRYVFISNNNLNGDHPGDTGTLVVIDRTARRIVEVIPVGANAAGVATNARR